MSAVGAKLGLFKLVLKSLKEFDVVEIVAVVVIGCSAFERFISDDAVSATGSSVASHYYNLIISR